MSDNADIPASLPQEEWFDRVDPDSGTIGLSFGCTMCGACCSGPNGYVLLNEEETAGLAKRAGISVPEFIERYTCETARGRSLIEVESPFGMDCVFLDRTTIPGKAICGVYEDRPAQCRTWPFWRSNLISKRAWVLAGRKCPGIDKGTHYTPVEIRVRRSVIDM